MAFCVGRWVAAIRVTATARPSRAIDSARRPQTSSWHREPPAVNSQAPEDERDTADDVLWQALCAAPAQGLEVSELMRITGWKRTKLYRQLREHAGAGRAILVSRGHWRARTTEEPSP